MQLTQIGSAFIAAIAFLVTVTAHAYIDIEAGETTFPEGFDVLHFGNSYTAQYPWAIDYFANEAGHTHDWHMVGAAGVPIGHFWNNDSLKERSLAALAAPNKWDAIVFQHYSNTGTIQSNIDNNAPEAIELSRLAWQQNIDCQVYIYMIWPRYADWDNPPEARLPETHEGIAAAIDAFRQTNFPDAPKVRVIPVGLAINALGEMIDANEIPELTDKLSIYKDGGHLNPEVGGYVMVMTHLACLYRENPEIHGNEPLYRDSNQAGNPVFTTNTSLAKRIREIVWDVVWNYPLSGVNPNLVIGTRTVPPAIVDLPYETLLTAGNGVAPFAWEIFSGELPNGITLAADGRLAGTPTQTGEFPFTARVSDSEGKDASREYTLKVSADTAPQIVQPTLPAWNQGSWAEFTLAAEGGNLPLKWRVTGGTLPHGLELTESGILTGDPGETGSFPVTLTVTDADPSGPETDTLDVTVEVGPPAEGTYLAGKTLRRPLIDGLLDDEIWAAIPGGSLSAGKAIAGNPDNTVSFLPIWDEDALYVAVTVTDSTLKPGDAVELYLDTVHDGQTIYNADDRHFTLYLDGTLTDIHDRTMAVDAAVQQTATGFTAEFRVPWEENLVIAVEPRDAIGLDVGNLDDDSGDTAPEHRLMWQGDANNTIDPTLFGNVILTPQEIGGAEAPPSAPGNLRVADTTFKTVTLNWDPSERAFEHVIEHSRTGGEWQETGRVLGRVGEFTATRLFQNSPYRFRIRALNDKGESEAVAIETSTPPKAVFLPVDGVVSIEGEHVSAVDDSRDKDGVSWIVADEQEGHSGSGYIGVLPDEGGASQGYHDSAVAQYHFQIDEPGLYYILVRLYAPDSGADSLRIGIDGKEIYADDYMKFFTPPWKWGTYNVSLDLKVDFPEPGTYTLDLIRRETGLLVDKIVIWQETNGREIRHSDFGPDESPRTGESAGTTVIAK